MGPRRQTFLKLAGTTIRFSHGGADAFHGDAGNDHIKLIDLSFSLVEGGIGSDVLHLDGSNLNLDLLILGDKISSIETISFIEEVIIL